MRHVIFTTLVLFINAFSAKGQEQERPNFTVEERAEFQTQMHKERLALSESQEESMHAINLKYSEEMETIMAGGRSFSTMRKLRDMGNRKDKEVKKILDKDQYKTYLDMKEEMREMMKERRKDGN